MKPGIPPHAQSSSTFRLGIVWLRRDLRLRDNLALAAGCRRSGQVCAAFVVDPQLLKSPRIGAPIVSAFFSALGALREELRARGSDLALLCGDPQRELLSLAKRTGAQAIFFNVDYEPAAVARDERAMSAFTENGISAHPCLDHVCYGAEVAREGGEAYKVFTPYRRAWLQRAREDPRPPAGSLRALEGKLLSADAIGRTAQVPQPLEFGFAPFDCGEISERAALRALDAFSRNGGMQRYERERDVPAADATSHLSVHLRAGTIGIRTCFERAAACGGDLWTNELIWREFYQAILRRFPHVAGRAFLDKAAAIPWRTSKKDFAAWCNGETGYPIVDAAMQQLNTTGWMHNRLRMIAASFLTKHLLIDWRRGERYFEQHLLDADLAQNNGGWQWSASTGTDAAPYFRIFNPVLQSKKFDPSGTFIRAMLPQLRGVPDKTIHAPWLGAQIADYPEPIVDHAFARQRALAAYGSVL